MLAGLSGATRLYPIIGDPIAQAKSPEGLTRAFREAGHDAIVIPLRVSPDTVDGILAALEAVGNVPGLIATVPHKFAAFRHAASASGRARLTGAANVLRRRRDGGWHADILDGLSMVHAIVAAGGRIEGRTALLAGAGGAGCAIGLALLEAGAAALTIHDTDAARSERLIALLSAAWPGRVYAGDSDPAGMDLVVNATPTGMRADDVPPVPLDRLMPGMFIADVVTAPETTPLLAAAQARGCAIATGIGMFEASVQLMLDFFTQDLWR